MAELVERQHYVPRTYLKNFGSLRGNDYYLHVLDRKSVSHDKIFESNTKNVALKKNLYTLPGKTTAQKMAIEKFYSEEIEQHYNSIYEILTNPEKKELSFDERELIISTVVSMFYRTTRWISLHNELMDQDFKSLFQLCKQNGTESFTLNGQKISIAGKTLKQFTEDYHKQEQPAMVATQLEVALKLIQLRLERDGILVVKLGEKNAEFITSDNPVIASNPSGRNLVPFNPQNTLMLPINPQHMLYLMPYSDPSTSKIIIRREEIGHMCNMSKLTSNFQQMQMAERFMFGTKAGLEGYLQTKEASERPLNQKEMSFSELMQKGKELGIF